MNPGSSNEATRQGDRDEVAQLRFLLRLSDALRHLDRVEDIRATAADLLATELGAARVGFADLAPGGDDMVVAAEDMLGFPRGSGGIPPAGGVTDRLRAGEIDVQADPGGHTAIVPLMEEGRLTGCLFVHRPTARAFGPGEIALLRETAARVPSAVDGARTRTALRNSEAQLAAALESVPVGIALLDANGRIVLANAEYRQFLPDGVIPSLDPIGQARWQAWDAAGERLAVTDYPGARAMRGERTFPGQEMLFTIEAGHQVWTRVASIPIFDEAGSVSGQASVISDIDALKRSADVLRESEARARLLVDGVATAVWEAASDGLVGVDSPSWRTFTGQSFDEWRGHGWLEAIHPDDREPTMRTWRDALRHRRRVDAEYRLRTAEGSYRWTNVRAVPLQDESGRVVKWLGLNIDIDDRKRLERSLRQSERRTRALIEGVAQLLWRAADTADWSWASPQWTAVTGQSAEASRGRGWLAMIHPEDRAATLAAWSRAPADRGFEVEHRLQGRDGGYRWFVTRAVPVEDDADLVVEWLGSSTDIDALRQAQARQGVLVAELQHRTRNLIAVVRALSEQTLDRSATLGEFEARFNDRLSALGRVQGLLSHASAGRKVTFDELLRSELAALGAGEPDERITLDGPPGVPLRSSAVQTLALALHELATNAVKHGALATRGGTLVVRWSIDRDDAARPALMVTWSESGVTLSDAGDTPTLRGYGRELIERALPFQLGAETRYVLGGDGLRCTIRVPAVAARAEWE